MIHWHETMQTAVADLLDQEVVNKKSIDPNHLAKTPTRVVAMYDTMFSGCNKNAWEELVRFPSGNVDQMVHVKNIVVYSVCAHHLLPFFGIVNFSYIPGATIVGLSKIPRMIDVLARRPQVQEKLTQEIADTFWHHVAPKGCGVVMRAYHLCMLMRGVQEHRAYTETAALQGCFKEDSVKHEFLSATRQDGPIWG